MPTKAWAHPIFARDILVCTGIHELLQLILLGIDRVLDQVANKTRGNLTQTYRRVTDYPALAHLFFRPRTHIIQAGHQVSREQAPEP